MAKVLHIEDDPRNLRLVRKLLGAVGHQVIEATSGLEGIALARAERPDLVLVDINVPDLDGYEITLRLRGIEGLSGVPIVAITAEGDRETSLAVGANGFIEKPIDAKRFVRTIGKFLLGHSERGDHTEPRLREQSHRIVERLEQKVRELSTANVRLEEMARLRRDFLRNVTHELATPLTPLVGYLHLLERGDLGPLTPQQRKALGAMGASMRKLRNTVDTLLDVSALESGQMSFKREPLSLAAVLDRVVDELRPAFQEARITLHVEPHVSEAQFLGDGEKVQRAIAHIVQNAMKFTPSGGSVGVACRTVDDVHLVLVADDGEGIPEEKRETVFEPFVQIDGSITRKHGGTGLGLAFARRVAEAHGGTVTIDDAASYPVAGKFFGGSLIRLVVAAGRPSP
ncbi:MAG: hybrid sensor histidine kinase/response regulator [Myxococcales bacterium]|nr:hybrid sensor histidine kinase/response regulator [Myxococcales bacterium]